MISRPGVATSTTTPQVPQATASVVWIRLVSGAPHPQLNANARAVAAPVRCASRRLANERLEPLLLADEEERRVLAVVERREPLVLAAQVYECRLPPRSDLERQLALPGDDVGPLDVDDLVPAAVELRGAADVDLVERRESASAAQERHEVVPHGVGQPAGALVVEERVPLVPGPRAVPVLDAADQREVRALVAAFGAELEGRSVLRQLGHLPDVLERSALLDEGRAAELADRDDGGGAPETDRRAAGWTVRGSHSLLCKTAFDQRASRAPSGAATTSCLRVRPS
jgi:hypothetical protein